MQWTGGSLMCTSNIAGNTQMASLDRQVTQNGLGVNNAMCKGIYNGGIPRYQDDGDSSLSSRNTLGNGKTTNQNLKDKSQTVVV